MTLEVLTQIHNCRRCTDKARVDVLVARQPIFDNRRSVYGYELLFRSSETKNHFDGTDASTTTQQVISGVLLSIGLDQVVCGKKAFVNFDDRLLTDGMHLDLPPKLTVIEILETVKPTAELVTLCRRAREQGYTLALDDFAGGAELEPLTQVVQMIKVDRRTTPKTEQEGFLRKYRPRGIKMLAEKIETYEEFEWARRAGYDYFQGYFFARPAVLKSKQVAPSKLNRLRLLSELQEPELDIRRLKALIQSDVALAYKLLRYVNSVMFAQRAEIRSIERALTIMGTNEIRRWVTLASLPTLVTDKPSELATTAVIRARFCERLIQLSMSNRRGREWQDAEGQNEAFLVGMFSLLDALLDCPLNEALGSMALAGHLKNVLLGTAPEGDSLKRIYHLTCEYEQGNWSAVEELSRACGISGSQVGSAYVEAALWADNMLREVCGLK